MSSSSFFRNVCLSDALLRVHSLAATLGFYRDVVGFRVIASAAGRAELSATGELPALLILEEHARAPSREAGTPGLFHLAFLFPDRRALATATLRLERYPVQGASDHGVRVRRFIWQIRKAMAWNSPLTVPAKPGHATGIP